MKLIGVPLSPYVRKVCVALGVKGVNYDLEPLVPGFFPPEFRQISPLEKIPVLLDGDLTLPDSSVICEYLEEKYPEPPLLPAGIADRARARFLEEFGDTRLLEWASVPFVQNFVEPRLRGGEPDPEKVRKAVEEGLPPVLDYVESRLPEEGFLFGHLCTCDLALVSPLINAAMGGYEVDAGRWPRYAAYVQRVREHEAVAAALAREAELLAAMAG